MVGAGLESGCWMVGEMVGDKVVVEWRLVVSVSVLGNGCIVVELALRLPKGRRLGRLTPPPQRGDFSLDAPPSQNCGIISRQISEGETKQ